jgi:hypothetical protein
MSGVTEASLSAAATLGAMRNEPCPHGGSGFQPRGDVVGRRDERASLHKGRTTRPSWARRLAQDRMTSPEFCGTPVRELASQRDDQSDHRATDERPDAQHGGRLGRTEPDHHADQQPDETARDHGRYRDVPHDGVTIPGIPRPYDDCRSADMECPALPRQSLGTPLHESGAQFRATTAMECERL